MGAREYWDRMLVYFGITEEIDDEHEAAAERPRSSAGSARRSSSAMMDSDGGGMSSSGGSSRSGGTMTSAGVGVVMPKTFNDAQKVADQFKDGVPVILNLQQTDPDLRKRIIENAYRMVKERYDWENIAPMMEEVFSKFRQ